MLTARLTDPGLYVGQLREMLRNEIRYTSAADGVPANLELKGGTLGPLSVFGAGEYAKGGLMTVTEYLGRTPWNGPDGRYGGGGDGAGKRGVAVWQAAGVR